MIATWSKKNGANSLHESGVWERMGTRVWVAETLWCASKTVTRLLISYTPRYNKKLKPNKNRNGATRKNISITNTMTKVFVVVCLFESCLMGSILQ